MAARRRARKESRGPNTGLYFSEARRSECGWIDVRVREQFGRCCTSHFALFAEGGLKPGEAEALGVSIAWFEDGRLEPYNPVGRSPGADLAKLEQQLPSAPLRKVLVAEEIMAKPVCTVEEDTHLDEALKLMNERRFRHLPVVAGETLLGVLSDRDLLRASAQGGWEGQRVKAWMTRRLLAALPQADITELARLMNEYRIGCIPILSEEHRLVGILTTADILSCVARHAPIEIWL